MPKNTTDADIARECGYYGAYHVEQMVEKARERAFSQYAFNYFMMKFAEDKFLDNELKDEHMKFYLKKWADEQPVANWFAYLITLNPRVDDMPTLKKAVEKFCSRVFMKHYKYCYEQRSTTPEEFHGFHAHILVFRNGDNKLSFSKLKRYAQNTFKHLCDVENEGLLNFKPIQAKFIQNAVKYISGTKDDNDGKHKAEKQNVDILFREHYHLSSIYFKDPIPPESGADLPDDALAESSTESDEDA